MPKHIKAVKCPQCGSTRATMLREDHYRCDSCSTEFFLDSDDITIHHKHETGADRSNPISALWDTVTASPRRKVLFFLALAFFFSFMTIIPIIALGIFGGSASRNSSDDKGVSLACEQLMTFTSTAGRPIVLVCGSARPKESVGDWDNAKGFMYFLDGETHEVIKELLLPEVTGRVSLTDGRQFADGTFYVILNKTHLYAIDRSTLDVNEIHGEDYKRPEFTEGFGEVELYYSQYGDALQGKTNLGQSFIYYPIANKLYSEKSIFDAYKEKLPEPKLTTHFVFSDQTTDYEDQQIQLVRYHVLEQAGYPRHTPSFGWENDSHSYYPKKVFVSSYHKEHSLLQSYEDFTPGAYYFSPKVIHESADQILIAFKPTAAADAKWMLRCLDAQTAKVLWTCTEEVGDFDFHIAASRFSGGYVLVDYSNTWLISSEGKCVSTMDVHNHFRS